MHGIPQKLRAAYSIVRSHFSIGSISRLDRFASDEDDPEKPYELYRSWLRSLLNAAIGLDHVSAPIKGHEHRPSLLDVLEKKSKFNLTSAFYREEILWLYNERALTALVQGNLYDALPVFEQAKRFSSRRDKETDGFRAAKRRIDLNLAATQIERGNIKKAEAILHDLEHRVDPDADRSPSVTQVLAKGFLGVCDHLSGRLDSARQNYTAILSDATTRGQLRTISSRP